MKSKSIANFASIVAVAAILPLGASKAHAISSVTMPIGVESAAQPPEFQRVEWNDEKRKILRRAYWLVEHADHDYAGHRVKALEQIRKAGEIMHMDLHKDGYGGEKLGSDESLKRARQLLKNVSEESGGKEFEHLHEAVHELDHALEVH